MSVRIGVSSRSRRACSGVADRGDHRGDDLLADRVERRIGHLGEELLEVVGEQLRPVGEHRQRGVVAHRADRLRACRGHRAEDHAKILEGVAEGPLKLEQAGPLLGNPQRVGQGVEPHLVAGHPLPPGLGRGQLPLDLVVFDDPAFLGVDQKHPPRLEPALADDLARRQLEHPRLAGHHHEPVLELPPAAGPEAVAVEGGPDPHAVGEGHRRRSVPGLHQAGLVLVVGLEVVGHALVAAPGLGDAHAHGLLDRPAGQHQELERVVEAGRVAAPLADHRLDFFQVGTVDGMGEHALAGVHPVDVAADGVDLAVVGEIPEGMGQVPGGEGVGAVPLVDEGQAAREPLVGQVGEILGHLIGQQQPLVDERLARQRADIDIRLLRKAERPQLDPEPLAEHEQLPLEVLAGHLFAAAHEGLADERLDVAGRVSDQRVVGGHCPPAQKVETLLAAELLEEGLGRLPLALGRGQEDVARGPVAGGRQRDAGLGGGHREKLLRQLDQDPGPVAGQRVRAGGPAVSEVFEHLEPLPHDPVALAAVHVDDEAHAAGVVLHAGVVEALGGGQARAAGWAGGHVVQVLQHVGGVQVVRGGNGVRIRHGRQAVQGGGSGDQPVAAAAVGSTSRSAAWPRRRSRNRWAVGARGRLRPRMIPSGRTSWRAASSSATRTQARLPAATSRTTEGSGRIEKHVVGVEHPVDLVADHEVGIEGHHRQPGERGERRLLGGGQRMVG